MTRKNALFLALLLTYMVMLFGGAAIKPGYSHSMQYISELNATGSAHALLIGWLGFVPFGLAALALWNAARPHALAAGVHRTGYWLLLAEPIAYIGSAFAPCDLGCPAEGSASQMLHNLLGLSTYLATTLALFLLAFSKNLSGVSRAAWVGLSLVWFVLFGLMLDESFSQHRGLLQRAAEWLVYPSLLLAAWRVWPAQAKPE